VRAVRKASAMSKAKGVKKPRVHLEFGQDGVTTVSPGLADDAEQSRVRGVNAAGELLAGEGLGAPLKANGAYLLDALGPVRSRDHVVGWRLRSQMIAPRS
jgi:hypothetical protein